MMSVQASMGATAVAPMRSDNSNTAPPAAAAAARPKGPTIEVSSAANVFAGIASMMMGATPGEPAPAQQTSSAPETANDDQTPDGDADDASMTAQPQMSDSGTYGFGSAA